jgi:hypothetical protein
MANLVARSADHVTVTTTEGGTNTMIGSTNTMVGSTDTMVGSTATTNRNKYTPLHDCISFWALTRQMASNIAEVANRIIGAVTGNMATLPTVVAGLLIGAFLL